MMMQNELEVGDEVVTTAGIYGTCGDRRRLRDHHGRGRAEHRGAVLPRRGRAAAPRRRRDGRRGRGGGGRAGVVGDPVQPRDPDAPATAVRTPDEPAPRIPVEPVPTRRRLTPPGAAEHATVTLEDVQDNDELSLFIASADRVMEAMGYTGTASDTSFHGEDRVQVLSRLGSTREATLASVAGYLHDVGNSLARDAHGRTARRSCTWPCVTRSTAPT